MSQALLEVPLRTGDGGTCASSYTSLKDWVLSPKERQGSDGGHECWEQQLAEAAASGSRGSPSIGSDGVWKAERLGLKMDPETGAQITEHVAWKQARTPPVAGISAAVILRDRS